MKLQALVRGHMVRKQTANMLRRMQTLVRLQARARANRAQLSESFHSSSKSSLSRHPVSKVSFLLLVQLLVILYVEKFDLYVVFFLYNENKWVAQRRRKGTRGSQIEQILMLMHYEMSWDRLGLIKKRNFSWGKFSCWQLAQAKIEHIKSSLLLERKRFKVMIQSYNSVA